MDFSKEFGGYPYIFRFRKPSKWTLSEIEEGYFYFANRKELNDPFDSHMSLLELTRNPKEITSLYNSTSNSFPDQKSREIFLETYSPHTFYYFMEEKLEFYISHYGIVCFSMHLKNYSMWANYAQNGEGLCLQFNVEKDKNLFKNIHPIEYLTEPKKIIFNPNSEIDTLDRLFFQKSWEWSNEKELRLLQVHNGRWKFNRDSLEKIILGYNSKPYFVNKVKRIVKNHYPNSHLFKMLQPTNYDKISLVSI